MCRCSAKVLDRPSRLGANHEKRKEKSRDAARSRRGKEMEVFTDLQTQLPIPPSILHTLDKASIMRVAIAHLKLRKLLGPEPVGQEKNSKVAVRLDQQYMKALDGFVLVIAKEGDIVFLSENVNKHLGLSQIELIGQSIYEFAHPCDHDEVKDVLEKIDPEKPDVEEEFFIRLKCTLTSKGKNINLKSATYKVIRCTGRSVTVTEDPVYGGATDGKTLTCVVLIAEPIPHPANIEVPLDNKTFLSTHSMNMKYTYCDPSISELIGYDVEDLMDRSLYSYFHTADIKMMNKTFSNLFNKGQTLTGLYRFLAKGGGYVLVETQATIIYNTRTEKPEHVVCVNYIISDIQEKELLLSDVQMVGMKKEKEEPPKTPATIVTDDVILSTEAILSKCFDTPSDSTVIEDTTEDLAYRAPTAGDVMVTLDLSEPDKLVSMEPLLPAIYEDIVFPTRTTTSTTSSSTSPVGSVGSILKLPFITSIQRTKTGNMYLAGGSPGGSLCDQEGGSATPPPPPLQLLSIRVEAGGTPPPSTPINITLLDEGSCSTMSSVMLCSAADSSPYMQGSMMNSPVSQSALGSPPHLIEISDVEQKIGGMDSRRTVILDAEDTDMSMRAPFISMSGEDDLMFHLMSPIPMFQDVRGVEMLGRTESVFNNKPAEEKEDSPPSPIPFSILRQQVIQTKEQEYLHIQKRPSMLKINVNTETNRLETGPPSKRSRFVVQGAGSPESASCSSSASSSDSGSGDPKDAAAAVVKGSSVLLNLLLSGEDRVNGYTIPNTPPLHTVLQQAGARAVSGRLRGLLTCPMVEPFTKDTPKQRPVQPPEEEGFTTFNADLLQVLGLTGGGVTANN